ncbi:unnamed protein product [Paramecium sonneborni]|uniref:Uncharacterized protein n=1 Tax=Paramecium sonneborni TaxID=65129 RepID=A0A8S1N757_9CILI|nr:unnamed protein product [Paramecium sonneborni]
MTNLQNITHLLIDRKKETVKLKLKRKKHFQIQQ